MIGGKNCRKRNEVTKQTTKTVTYSSLSMATTNPRGPKADQESTQSTADMTAFVQNLIVQMQDRFQAMSNNIISKIDEMGGKIDELEQSITDLKAEMGAEDPIKSKPEDDKPSNESV